MIRQTIKAKQNNWRDKPAELQKPRLLSISKLSLALLLCMSLFIAPITTVYAGDGNGQSVTNNPVAPPTVEAEIIGSLLRIRTTSGFFAVEAVYINGRRFNHRVDSALVIDISQYIATGGTIAIFAVDFAGNQSDTILLTPPPPTQPPPPNNFTPDGQGEVLDHLHSGDGIEFITITTPVGNVFHLIIDHTRSSNNVFFLNAVTEWDLLTLAAEAELPIPPNMGVVQAPTQPTAPIVTEQEPPATSASAEETIQQESDQSADEDEGGSRVGTFIFLAIAGAGAFGAIYYSTFAQAKS